MTGRCTYRFRTHREGHLLSPVTRYPRYYVFLGDISYPDFIIFLWVVSEHYSLDLVLRLAEPAFFHVMQYRLDFRLLASDVALVANCYT
jgi:hypothetical protein